MMPNVDDLYREVIMDHYRHPRGRHSIARADASAAGDNPLCGDSVALTLTLEGDRILDAAIHGQGCAISMAAGSMLAEVLPGMQRQAAITLVEQVRQMLHGAPPPSDEVLEDVGALAGVAQFPMRVKCAMLPFATLSTALGETP